MQNQLDVIQLGIFASRIAAICDEMGSVLRRSAFSPNIRDRLDFSCAIFDARGELCAQAAHIPVHLGSMAYAMRSIVSTQHWCEGDMLVVNDPFLGGTHLPDVTLIAPVFVDQQCIAFVANRAHHANIGAVSPGSMPISRCLEEEGIIIPPSLIMKNYQLNRALLNQLAGLSSDLQWDEHCLPDHPALGDFLAQVSCNRAGVASLTKYVMLGGKAAFELHLQQLNENGERLARAEIQKIPAGIYLAEECLDDDGLGQFDIAIKLQLHIDENGGVLADFSGTADQVQGNVNSPLSVAAAAVFYVFRCLMPSYTPACAGIFRPIQLQAPLGCLLNAERPAAVAAGNVETSTRIVDVVLKALAQALPQQIPAASHGSMNNVAMGAEASAGQRRWDYYETIGGGMGASALSDGLNAVQTHMTNTLNTPVEVLESAYPLRVMQYSIRTRSGGAGLHAGGNGIVRSYQFLRPAKVTLLTERRRHAPWGAAGGQPAEMGENHLNGQRLPGKTELSVQAGDVLKIISAGGGGWGAAGHSQPGTKLDKA